MKVAISSLGKDLDSTVSEVFGRCPYFIIAEIEGKKIKGFEAVENTFANQMGNAGISAAQAVAEKDVKAVITGNLGPKASDVLRQFDIESYIGYGRVREVLQKFMEGKLGKAK